MINRFKRNTALLIFSFVLSISFNQLQAQEATKEVSLANTQTFSMRSEEVGDDYEIYVSLPFGYQQGSQNFRTLYVLDANVTFGMVRDIQTLISFEPGNPPMIIVGVGYANFNKWIQSRSRDYMPNSVATAPGSGGAQKYMDFLEKELIPRIEKDYRASDHRIVYGHSTAALFGLYALYTNPSLFNGYIVTSPSVDEDEGFALNLEKENANTAISARVYTSAGTEEKPSFLSAYEQLVSALKAGKHEGLAFLSESFEATHMSSMAPSFVKGLQFVNKD